MISVAITKIISLTEGHKLIQQDLFSSITDAYANADGGRLDNNSLYSAISDSITLEQRVPIGTSGELHNPAKRKIRWHQQTLKQLGLIERVDRGVWQLTSQVKDDLHRATSDVKLVAFSTDLGVAIWARQQDVFSAINEPISLCITSPPYPLRNARAYGNPSSSEYVDFVCMSLESIVKNLTTGASVILNISNDIFEHKSPARSLYVERLVIALHDRLGLHLMDRIPWVNLSKPPGPTYWACVNRVQLSAAYEPIFWFTNDPHNVRSDNRRVLEAHTEKHQQLMQSGGANRHGSYGDGAYTIRPHSYGNVTAGKIPRNVIQRGHSCKDTLDYRKNAKLLSLPIHGAMQPTSIPDFFVRLLTEPDDLVVDPFGGTIRTGLAAERLGRRWVVTEWIAEYLRGAAELFRGSTGFDMHPAFQHLRSI